MVVWAHFKVPERQCRVYYRFGRLGFIIVRWRLVLCKPNATFPKQHRKTHTPREQLSKLVCLLDPTHAGTTYSVWGNPLLFHSGEERGRLEVQKSYKYTGEDEPLGETRRVLKKARVPGPGPGPGPWRCGQIISHMIILRI